MRIPCSSPWCNRSAKGSGRSIARTYPVCRSCYQYVWEQSKKLEKPMAEIFLTLPSPNRKLRDESTCARSGCEQKFAEGEFGPKRRSIGLITVCSACYEAAWELSRKKSISLAEALTLLPEKGKHLTKEQPTTKCATSWCPEVTVADETHKVADNLFVCSKCRRYLRRYARRFSKASNSTWQDYALQAAYGKIIAPGSLEECSMPWCHRRERPRQFGPHGEPICNTDSVYLFFFAKRKNITFHHAFEVAPPPRKDRGRKRK